MVLALFDPKLAQHEQPKMARKLRETPRTLVWDLGKPQTLAQIHSTTSDPKWKDVTDYRDIAQDSQYREDILLVFNDIVMSCMI